MTNKQQPSLLLYILLIIIYLYSIYFEIVSGLLVRWSVGRFSGKDFISKLRNSFLFLFSDQGGAGEKIDKKEEPAPWVDPSCLSNKGSSIP